MTTKKEEIRTIEIVEREQQENREAPCPAGSRTEQCQQL
jgi:hypothetical protein